MNHSINVTLEPIGYVSHELKNVPRHWSVSDLAGNIVIRDEYSEGIKDIKAGDEIVVIFYFHKSPPFNMENLRQNPTHIGIEKGVFSTCSPKRPNPFGLSVLEVMAVNNGVISVRGIDILDGTPVIDIKPNVRK